jgi:O-acetyl-ADP-ribose deacetylase (regulator of RNase III)
MSATVIPYRFWQHKVTGAKASLYGARHSTWNPDDWKLVTEGFTIAWPDGTTGCGRPPFATVAEAQAVIDRRPNFTGMSQY